MLLVNNSLQIDAILPNKSNNFVGNMIINQETKDFISRHSDEDVRKVALSGKPAESVDLPFALQQIAGRQTAKTKLPSWYAAEDVIFPPHISMEQCSSEQTAEYKVAVMQSVMGQPFAIQYEAKKCHFIDFTGGFGVDFSYMAKPFSSATYIERQEHLCDIAQHNLPLLGLKDAEVVCTDSVEAMQKVSDYAHGKPLVVFMDPARRDTNGQRTYAIADCTPDVTSCIDDLLRQTQVVMIKLSPMLDWHSAVRELNDAAQSHDAVREIHIVSVGNECKELLLLLSDKYSSPLSLHCVNDAERFVIHGINAEEVADINASAEPLQADGDEESNELQCSSSVFEAQFLYVPNASVMKAGCFSVLESTFSVKQVSLNSHLFFADGIVKGFPGRAFRVRTVTTMNKKELRKALDGVTKANIATRNFPISPENLRKKLKLKDGGETYIFATTTADNDHILIVCDKDNMQK